METSGSVTSQFSPLPEVLFITPEERCNHSAHYGLCFGIDSSLSSRVITALSLNTEVAQTSALLMKLCLHDTDVDFRICYM